MNLKSLIHKVAGSPWGIPALFALLKLILHLAVITRYDYFRDEFYYLACSETPRLDFGYVDHPPLSVIGLWLVRFLFGDSLPAIRIWPILAGALTIFLTGIITREIGGGRFAVSLACAAALSTPGNYAIFHFYSMNAFDILFWQFLILILLRLINGKGDPRALWLLFGITAGIGLLNKISVLFIGFGVVVGLLAGPERRWFKTPHPWIAGLTAFVLFSPYLLWNAVLQWPALEFAHNASTYKNIQVSPLEFLAGQLLYNNPLTALVWGVGLWFFLVSTAGKKYRLFGWMFPGIFFLLMSQHGKSYYMAGAYFILFAGGSVLWERWLNRSGRWVPAVKTALFLAPTSVALFFLPVTLPILTPEAAAEHAIRTGLSEHAEENHEKGRLPQHFADMFGWREMTAQVANVYALLPPDEQKKCLIYAQNYGVAGALNFLGKPFRLPPAISGHNNFFFWKPKNTELHTLIIVGGRREDHLQAFASVVEMARTFHPFAMPYENNNGIFICRHPKLTLDELWPHIKHFE